MFYFQWRPDTGSQLQVYFKNEPDNPHWGWSWLERWMAARPWENRMLDQNGFKEQDPQIGEPSTPETPAADTTPTSRITKVATTNSAKGSSAAGSVRTSPLSATSMAHVKHHQYRHPPNPTHFDQSSDTASSASRLLHDRAVLAVMEGNVPGGKRSYMGATKSARAKVRSQSTPKQRPTSSSDEVQVKKKRLSLPMKGSTAGSTVSPMKQTYAAGGYTISPTLTRDFARVLPPIMRYNNPSARSGEISMSSYGDPRRPFR